jgi:predicted MFS family arabinose efflux permease
MLAVYTVVELPVAGLASAQTIGFGASALVLFVAFLVRQATAAKPLLPLQLFRSRNISGSNVLQLLLVAGMFGFFFLDTLYLRRVLGYNAIRTGLAFLPVTIAIGALSLGWSAQLSTRFGPRAVVIGGIVLSAAGLAVFAIAPLDAAYVTTIFPAMLLIGLGMGAAFPSLMMFAMSGATSSDAGLVSGLINTTAQVGGAFGLAVLATISAWRTHDVLASGAGNAAALAAGYHLAFGICAGCLVAAGIIAATVLETSPESESDSDASRSTAA